MPASKKIGEIKLGISKSGVVTFDGSGKSTTQEEIDSRPHRGGDTARGRKGGFAGQTQAKGPKKAAVLDKSVNIPVAERIEREKGRE